LTSGFQPGFRDTQRFRERQPGIPPVASESVKITTQIVEKHKDYEPSIYNKRIPPSCGNIRTVHKRWKEKRKTQRPKLSQNNLTSE